VHPAGRDLEVLAIRHAGFGNLLARAAIVSNRQIVILRNGVIDLADGGTPAVGAGPADTLIVTDVPLTIITLILGTLWLSL